MPKESMFWNQCLQLCLWPFYMRHVFVKCKLKTLILPITRPLHCWIQSRLNVFHSINFLTYSKINLILPLFFKSKVFLILLLFLSVWKRFIGNVRQSPLVQRRGNWSWAEFPMTFLFDYNLRIDLLQQLFLLLF